MLALAASPVPVGSRTSLHGGAASCASEPAPARLPALQTIGLAKSYGGLQAVAGVDLSLARGRISGLIGPNGAGKTTLLNLVSGVEKPTSGTILLNGSDATDLAPHRLAAQGLIRTFQICRDLGELTVLENLLVARPRQTGEALIGAFFKGRRVREEEEAAIETARGILESVKLWNLADEPASSLSGGQKKLLELCRALMAKPEIVLLDEPAAGVAPALEQILVETIRALVAQGVTFLIVEHDLDVVAALCEHVYVMAAGGILTEGSFEDVTADARVLDAYLGAAR
jgi:ABC-type branched-subunit amino acid transport system ATPase component